MNKTHYVKYSEVILVREISTGTLNDKIQTEIVFKGGYSVLVDDPASMIALFTLQNENKP